VRYIGWVIGLGAGTLCAVMLAGLAVDDAFRIHMGILSVVLGLATIVAMRLPQPVAAESSAEYMDGPIRIGSILTVFWGIVGFLVGVERGWIQRAGGGRLARAHEPYEDDRTCHPMRSR